jgi:hypothetical protein
VAGKDDLDVEMSKGSRVMGGVSGFSFLLVFFSASFSILRISYIYSWDQRPR